MMTLQAREWMKDTHRPPQNSDDMARTRKYLAMLAVIAGAISTFVLSTTWSDKVN